jgi:hypothetical protein
MTNNQKTYAWVAVFVLIMIATIASVELSREECYTTEQKLNIAYEGWVSPSKWIGHKNEVVWSFMQLGSGYVANFIERNGQYCRTWRYE